MVMRCNGSLSDIWLTMAMKCSTDPAYDGIWVWLGWVKDFGPILVALASYYLARRVSKITRRQKEINEKAYDLNLFKERFAVWNEFQDTKETIGIIKEFFIKEGAYIYKGDFSKTFLEVSDEFESYKNEIDELIVVLNKITLLFPINSIEIHKHIEYLIEIYNNHSNYLNNTSLCKDARNIYRRINDKFIQKENKNIIYDENFVSVMIEFNNDMSKTINSLGDILDNDEKDFLENFIVHYKKWENAIKVRAEVKGWSVNEEGISDLLKEADSIIHECENDNLYNVNAQYSITHMNSISKKIENKYKSIYENNLSIFKFFSEENFFDDVNALMKEHLLFSKEIS